MTRDEIFALFRVPGPIAGLVENMGLGADIWFGARVMFCEGTIQPKLELIGQTLTRADSVVGEHSWNVTPTSVNQLRFGYTRRGFERAALASCSAPSIVGVPLLRPYPR